MTSLRPAGLLACAALLAAVTGASAPLVEKRTSCGFAGSSVSCGDPEVEARVREKALSADETRASGCAPLSIGPPAQDGTAHDPPAPSRAPRIHVPDQAIATRVDRAWDRIEHWLAAHAPATLRTLKPGVAPQDLTRWKRRIDLPDDLYVSYLRHNGADDQGASGLQLPPSRDLLGIEGGSLIASANCDLLVLKGDLAAADPETGEWHGSLIPIGHDSEGPGLFIEPRTGRVGESEFGERLRYDGPMGWPSFLAMLEALANALETGGPVRGWRPVVSGGELGWRR